MTLRVELTLLYVNSKGRTLPHFTRKHIDAPVVIFLNDALG